MQTKVSILTYHSIDDSGSVISTKLSVFRRQMKFLSEASFNVISLKTLAAFYRENNFPPQKTVVLTFDDGFQNFYTAAYPVLKDYDFTATVFLITDYCGKFNDWSGNLPSLEKSKLMSWNEIRELNKSGIEFGAHSRTHPDLTKTSPDQAIKEIVESKFEIENRLGVGVTDFAYPYGNYNRLVKSHAEQNYQTACSTRLGKVDSESDFFALQRLDAYYLSDERIFRAVLSHNVDWYLGLRQGLRDLKAAWYSR